MSYNIHPQGRFITKAGVNINLQNPFELNYSHLKMSHFSIPSWAKRVFCFGCELDSINIFNGLGSELDLIACGHNNLYSLELPNGIREVFCFRNNITSLIIPQSVEYIGCDIMNGIEEQNRKGLIMRIHQKS